MTINGITGKHTFAETILKYAKTYSDIAGADFICTNIKESEYSFVPGCKIAGALDYGKE